MGIVLLDITTSLDGFVAGANDRVGQGLGERGAERIHDWFFKGTTVSRHNEWFKTSGRSTEVLEGATRFTFVADGIASALEQARAAAGDRNVVVMGGASVAQQYLAAGLLDEIQIHVAPLLLGMGIRLFGDLAKPVELETIRVIEAPGVTHLRYRVVTR